MLVICPPFPVSVRNILISNYNVFFIICQMSTSVQALYQMTATTTQFVPTLKVLSYADASMVILEMAQIAQVNNLKVLCFNFITVYVVIQFYPRFKQIKPFIPNTFTMALQQKRGNLIHFELRTKNSGESTKEVISMRRNAYTYFCGLDVSNSWL